MDCHMVNFNLHLCLYLCPHLGPRRIVLLVRKYILQLIRLLLFRISVHLLYLLYISYFPSIIFQTPHRKIKNGAPEFWILPRTVLSMGEISVDIHPPLRFFTLFGIVYVCPSTIVSIFFRYHRGRRYYGFSYIFHFSSIRCRCEVRLRALLFSLISFCAYSEWQKTTIYPHPAAPTFSDAAAVSREISRGIPAAGKLPGKFPRQFGKLPGEFPGKYFPGDFPANSPGTWMRIQGISRATPWLRSQNPGKSPGKSPRNASPGKPPGASMGNAFPGKRISREIPHLPHLMFPPRKAYLGGIRTTGAFPGNAFSGPTPERSDINNCTGKRCAPSARLSL